MKIKKSYIGIIIAFVFSFLYTNCTGPDELIDYDKIKSNKEFYLSTPPLMTKQEQDSILQARQEFQNFLKQ